MSAFCAASAPATSARDGICAEAMGLGVRSGQDVCLFFPVLALARLAPGLQTPQRGRRPWTLPGWHWRLGSLDRMQSGRLEARSQPISPWPSLDFDQPQGGRSTPRRLNLEGHWKDLRDWTPLVFRAVQLLHAHRECCSTAKRKVKYLHAGAAVLNYGP